MGDILKQWHEEFDADYDGAAKLELARQKQIKLSMELLKYVDLEVALLDDVVVASAETVSELMELIHDRNIDCIMHIHPPEDGANFFSQMAA